MSDASDLERRHQVFVSSTYLDLVPERRAVIQALLELECIPAGMEMFPAADEDQWSLIKDVIDSCDYYIVIVGGRYGSVTEEGISFTEMEYEYAVEQGIPVLGFVHANPGQIPLERSEIDGKARVSLEGFRDRVMQRMVKAYSTPDELASVVSRGLVRAMRTHPRPGWVRGNHAMTDAVRAQIAELRASLAEAEKRQTEEAATRGADTIDESFEHGEDKVDLTFSIRSTSYEFVNHTVELGFTWDEIVEMLGPFMIDEASEQQLREIICADAMAALVADPDDDTYRKAHHPKAYLTDDSWGRILVQLRALRIITTGKKKRTVSDKAVYWTLTPAGDEYLVRLLATVRSQ